jgi:putative cell wall-binding protein
MHVRTRLSSAFLGAALLALSLTVVAPATAASAAPVGVAGFDGNPATTERVNEGHPTFAAVDISQLRFPSGGADHVVLARADTFADSVAGSGLTSDGPLLYTATRSLPKVTSDEIDRVLGDGGTVYLLGGTAAISDGVASTLRDGGHRVVRLAGADRIATALAIADEVRRLHPGDEVLLARASGWADSVTGGALAAARDIPVLITPTSTLDPRVASWLAADDPSTTYVLGGTAAVSNTVESQVPNPTRLSGTDRTATAAAVARELGTDTKRFVVTQGLADDGWSFGFASAGLAADAEAPILLVTDEVTDATAALVRTCGTPTTDIEVVGDGTVVPAQLREQLDAADGLACGPRGALVYPTDLSTFPACADLLASIKQDALERVGPYGLGGYGTYGPRVIETVDSPAAPNADTGGSTTSSTTNNQEEGVDEPDIVKTTDTHAYVVAQNDLRIVRLNDGAPTVTAVVDLPDDGSTELLVSGNRVLALTRSFGFILDGPRPAGAADSLVARGASATTLTSIDVTDDTHPVVQSTMDIDGDYRSARMVGGVARIVLQSDPNDFAFEYPTDATPEAEQAAAQHNRDVIAASTLDDWLPAYTLDGRSAPLLGCSDVRRPPLFSGLGTLSVVTVDVAAGLAPTSTAAVLASGETVYASTTRLFVTTGRWNWSPDALGTTVTTEVHGFDISSPSATTYVGSGSAPGYVLNQYALSELDGNLRIATTLVPPWLEDGTQVGDSESGIHVLAPSADGYREIGAVTGLGRGEQIYGVRYFGDLAAVVTFRQTDPLFLVDLSDPTAPRVTGQLELPGYSAYLHRLDDGRLLGVGAEADDTGRVTGAQVSLFDVHDTSQPALLDRITYPDAYTQVQWDPHAFLWWAPTGLAVLPMQEYRPDGPGFQGAVGITAGATSLTEVGRATHFDDVSDPNAYPQITRSFVSASRLYTVSDNGIEGEDLATLAPTGFARF